MKKAKLIALILVLTLLGTRGYFLARNKVAWERRKSHANKSLLDNRLTNGRKNQEWIEIARRYLSEKPVIYFERSLISSTDPKLKGIGFDPQWFMTHAPNVGYNPAGKWEKLHEFMNDRVIVSWRFMPGCEKKGSSWVDSAGRICLGGHGVSVIINNQLKAERVDILALD